MTDNERRIPIEEVEEIIIDDEQDDFVAWYQDFMSSNKDIEGYDAKLVDENEACVRVLTDGIYKEDNSENVEN